MTDATDTAGNEQQNHGESHQRHCHDPIDDLRGCCALHLMLMLVPDYSFMLMHAKLAFVVLLIGYHHWYQNRKDSRTTPTPVAMSGIAGLTTPVVGLVTIAILVVVNHFFNARTLCHHRYIGFRPIFFIDRSPRQSMAEQASSFSFVIKQKIRASTMPSPRQCSRLVDNTGTLFD